MKPARSGSFLRELPAVQQQVRDHEEHRQSNGLAKTAEEDRAQCREQDERQQQRMLKPVLSRSRKWLMR